MKKKRYKSYHLIIIPHDKTQSKSFIFTVKTLKLLTLVTIILIVTFSTLITLHTRNFCRIRIALLPTLDKNTILRKENREIKEENKSLELMIDSLATQLLSERAVHRERLKSLNVQVKRVKRFAENLRIMAGFKLEPKEAQPPGLGGPIPKDKDATFLLIADVEKEEILLAFSAAERSLLLCFREIGHICDFFNRHFSGCTIPFSPQIIPLPPLQCQPFFLCSPL